MKALGVFTVDIDGAVIAMICRFYSNIPAIVYVISEESRVLRMYSVMDKDKMAKYICVKSLNMHARLNFFG